MPKFYRQNKKRIDPRYFLNETTNRDEDINEIEMSNQEDQTFQYNQAMAQKEKEQGRTAFDQLEYDIEDIFRDSEFMNKIGRAEVDKINDVIAKVQKSGTGRSASLVPDSVVPATDDEKAQLAAAVERGSEALYSVINQIAGSGQGGSADTDNDGIPDEKELAIIDKGEIPGG